MVDNFWDPWVEKIDAKITKYGQVGAIRPESGSDIPVKLIVALYDQQERDGEMIQNTDKKVFVSPVGISVDPTTSDRCVISGTPHRIVAVDMFNPSGTVLCYVLQVR